MSNYAQMGPSGNLVALTPDTGVITTTRGLWVGTAGEATIVTESGQTLTNFVLLQGLNPFRVTRITTATAADIYAVY